jgi:Fe2+ or Zn2+ uptake regulation protein
MEKTTEWLKCLQENGYRVTAPRQVVVAVMAESQRVLNPFEVHEIARRQYPKLGLVTVYRTLEKLEELHLIQRVHQPSGCQAFVTAFSGHQHLLICKDCGKVEFFEGDGEGIDSLIQNIHHRSGYIIDDHWLQLFGHCERCQSTHKASL